MIHLGTAIQRLIHKHNIQNYQVSKLLDMHSWMVTWTTIAKQNLFHPFDWHSTTIDEAIHHIKQVTPPAMLANSSTVLAPAAEKVIDLVDIQYHECHGNSFRHWQFYLTYRLCYLNRPNAGTHPAEMLRFSELLMY